MERLTKKNNGNTPYNQTEYPYLEGADINDITNKLGKLEDIEEELGIGLIDLYEKVKSVKNNELSDAVGLLVVATLFASDNPKKFINDLAQDYKDTMIEEVNNDE